MSVIIIKHSKILQILTVFLGLTCFFTSGSAYAGFTDEKKGTDGNMYKAGFTTPMPSGGSHYNTVMVTIYKNGKRLKNTTKKYKIICKDIPKKECIEKAKKLAEAYLDEYLEALKKKINKAASKEKDKEGDTGGGATKISRDIISIAKEEAKKENKKEQ